MAHPGRDKKNKRKKSLFDERLLAVARDALVCPRLIKVQQLAFICWTSPADFIWLCSLLSMPANVSANGALSFPFLPLCPFFVSMTFSISCGLMAG